jgi:hypothetical protein
LVAAAIQFRWVFMLATVDKVVGVFVRFVRRMHEISNHFNSNVHKIWYYYKKRLKTENKQVLFN